MSPSRPWKTLLRKTSCTDCGQPPNNEPTMQQLDGVPNAMDGDFAKYVTDVPYGARPRDVVSAGGSDDLPKVNMDHPLLYNGEQTVKATEVDPSGLSAKDPGAKLDVGKAPMYQGITNYFPRALKAVAVVSAGGAAKYSWNGWEIVVDGINRYNNAMERHQVDRVIQGEYDPEGFLHRAQIAWNALAALELWLREQEAKNG